MLARILAFWRWLVAEVRRARTTERPKDAVTVMVRASDGPVVESRDLAYPMPRPKDAVTVMVRASDGPVVESRDLAYPMPLVAVPVRSTKATAKRVAHEWAERHSGRSMTWKQAQRYIDQQAKANPGLEVAVNDRDVQALAMVEATEIRKARSAIGRFAGVPQ